MPHWRDGGIGNVAGSDDRPIEEWTLLEKLNELASTPMGARIPRCLGGSVNIAEPMSKIAQDAFDEIRRLRDVEVRLTARVAVLEIGVNEALTALSSKIAKPGLALPEKDS